MIVLYQPRVDQCFIKNQETSARQKSLKLVDMSSAFAILGLGISVSVLVFLLELIYKRFKNRYFEHDVADDNYVSEAMSNACATVFIVTEPYSQTSTNISTNSHFQDAENIFETQVNTVAEIETRISIPPPVQQLSSKTSSAIDHTLFQSTKTKNSSNQSRHIVELGEKAVSLPSVHQLLFTEIDEAIITLSHPIIDQSLPFESDCIINPPNGQLSFSSNHQVMLLQTIIIIKFHFWMTN